MTTTVRTLIVAAICITVLLTGASSALAVGEKDLNITIVPTSDSTYIFLGNSLGSTRVVGGTVSVISKATYPTEYFDNKTSSRTITLHCIVKRIKDGGVLYGKREIRERQDVDIILPDHEFRVGWDGGTSEWTRDRKKTAELLTLVTLCSPNRPFVSVREAPVPDRIIIVAGRDTIWTGEWHSIGDDRGEKRVPWDPDTTRPPIRPGEEFPDERSPLPAPGEPGWDIH